MAVVARSLLILTPTLAFAGAAFDPQSLVETREGTLPIIFSAPHGGTKPIPNTPTRQGVGVAKFVTGRDGGTDELTRKTALHLEKKLGGKPFMVIAHFERKHADANRSFQDAYESDNAKPVYDAYHAALKKAHATVERKWGRGVVFDFHGQGADAKAIFRGTNNGRTTQHLIDRFGKPAVIGSRGVFGVLAARGIPVIPANDSGDAEDKRYSGGYIVQTYGSKEGGTIDGIQFEFGVDLRTGRGQDKTAEDVAEAIAVFAREYLPR